MTLSKDKPAKDSVFISVEPPSLNCRYKVGFWRASKEGCHFGSIGQNIGQLIIQRLDANWFGEGHALSF